MDRGVVWTTLASLAGLGLMGFVAATTSAPLVGLADLERHVGSTVRVEGRLLALESHKSGWTNFLLSDGNASIPASTPSPPTVSDGDWVEATGVVLRLNGRLRLDIDSSQDLVVKRSWSGPVVPLSRLLAEPWQHQDGHVRTSGVLDRSGLVHHLRDPASGGRVRAFGDAIQAHEPGTFLIIDAHVEYDPETATFRLRVLDARVSQPAG